MLPLASSVHFYRARQWPGPRAPSRGRGGGAGGGGQEQQAAHLGPAELRTDLREGERRARDRCNECKSKVCPRFKGTSEIQMLLLETISYDFRF